MRQSKIIHDEFVKMWNDGVAISEIALKFGVSNNYVSHYAYQHRAECPKHEIKLPVCESRMNHEEFVKLWNDDVGISEIALKFGERNDYISHYAYRHRAECPKHETISRINHEEFVRLWNANANISEIALRFGISNNYVYSYAFKHRAECPVRQEKTCQNNHDEFVKMWNNADVSIKEIAKKFEVSIPMVYKYAKNHKDECPKVRRHRKNSFR